MSQLQVWAPSARSVELVNQDGQSFAPPVMLRAMLIVRLRLIRRGYKVKFGCRIVDTIKLRERRGEYTELNGVRELG